ncbi:uncharacterized protein LOC113512391 [Galleria mellonella]|uniref:Uncharacterized protein LOC113512391 n=1 Tax=Galleria mellonella TaxID=7137 RepID=A0A6J1WLY2_GALME|nr:uncharacterized protein LOC113512391 [Galleria mellonella]
MWYTWTLLLVSCALVKADVATGVETSEPVTTIGSTTLQPAETESTTVSIIEESYGTTIENFDQEAAAAKPVTTTRPPPLTLDRQAGELAWRSWLQSPESGNQNAPPRRIITKSLFITPLVCPKGQRLDRNGCVQVMTVNKDEHERILLEQLNALFPSVSNGDVLYDYDDDEPGPLQLSIPIGLDPQAAPLQSQEPSAQAQDLQPSYVQIDKKDNTTSNGEVSIEAELELLKLQNSNNSATDGTDVLNHNVMNNLLALADKPKRDSPVNKSTVPAPNATDEGQKELVYGHVNVDPVLYGAENANQHTMNNGQLVVYNKTSINIDNINTNSSSQELKTDLEGTTKLNPENDYSDIGEAIKLISRYAEVTTDDNFSKNQKKYAIKDDGILGTRTKLQHRRNRPKPDTVQARVPPELISKDKIPLHVGLPKTESYYRYPWIGQHSPTPPPDYPFRHLQDYWPGRTQVGGVYNIHENPRRHHHSYPHYFKPRGYYVGNGAIYNGQDNRSGPLQFYPHMVTQRHAIPMQPRVNNQDLYSLLGLRHWFSSEGTSKR